MRKLHRLGTPGVLAVALLMGLGAGGARGAAEEGLGLYRDGQLVEMLGDAQLFESTTGTQQLNGPANAAAMAPAVSPETQLRNALFRRAAEPAAEIHEQLRKLKAAGLSLTAEDYEQLQRLLTDFTAAQGDIWSALAQIENQIEEFNLDPLIMERHQQTITVLEDGMQEFTAAVTAVLLDEDEALEQALEVLERLKFREDPPLLQSGLPYAVHTEDAPRLSREEADQALQSAQRAVSAQQTSSPPTPGDLAATPDVQLTQAIIDKAAELSNSPLAIYEFVHNLVEFQPYPGSRKGAVETLQQSRGNDTDQVSLLLALLRVSNIPSRYVRGTVELKPAAVMSWLGVDDGLIAANLLATAGLDAVAIFNGPDLVAIRFTHVWAEAYVPYGNYRGVPNDQSGKLWVALDPSFKGSTITPGEDVLAAMGFNIDSFLADYISAFTEPSPVEQLELDIQAYLDANDPGKTVADIERRTAIKAQLLGVLPASSQGTVLAIHDEFAELADNRRYKVRFHLYDGGTEFIDHTLKLTELAGKRLTIDYVGATPADQATIDSFGGIYNTPPNLVQVTPRLKLDNIAIATAANAIGMGRSHSSDMEFIAPVGASNVQPSVQNQIIAGNGQAIAFDTFLDTHDAFIDGADFPPEAFLESVLQITAADYLNRVDRGQEKVQRLMGMVSTQGVSEAIVANAIRVSFSSGIPVTFEWTGLIVDADRRIIGPFAVDNDSSNGRPYMMLTGIDGSTMENQVFEDIFEQEAISTIKILELASDNGITICTIETSIVGDCPGMNQPFAIQNAVNTALLRGHVVTIPEAPITVALWSGTGYIDMDPVSGAAGYIISGGFSGDVQVIAGGATVDLWPVSLPCEATDVTAEILIPPADRPDAGAVFCVDDSTITFKSKLTITCEDGSTKVQNLNLTTHKTKKQFGGGNYEFQLRVLGTLTIRKFAIVEVEKLEANEGDEWDDEDGSDDTKTVVLKKDPSGDVTVTATPKPIMAEAHLPACWSLTGGTGSGKLMRTVTKTTAAKTSIKAKAGTSKKDLDVVVAKAVFTRASNENAGGNKYGYDEIVTATDDDDHVSVKKSDSTHVQVEMEGSVDRKYLKFVPVSDSVAKVTDPGMGTGNFILEIKGQATDKGNTEIKIHAAKDTGGEISKIAVNVYKEIVLTTKYFNVFKAGDPSTKVSPPPSGSDISTRANKLLKAYVAKMNVGAPTDKGIAFDFNGNGKLDFYNTAPNAEYDKVISELNTAGAGFADIAIIKDNFPDRWYLNTSITATAGSPVTKFNVAGGASLIDTTEQWRIEGPNGGNSEAFTIVSISGTELTIDTDAGTPGLQGLTSNHNVTADPMTSETLVATHTVAGLGNNIAADRPALIVGATANGIGEIAAHEQSHGQGMADVNDSTNTMHCNTNTNFGNLPFRFMELQRVVTGVCGTAMSGKDNQWETPARP